MTIRLYLDEDAMDQDLVRALRMRALDVVTALQMRGLLKLVATMSAEEMQNRVEFLSLWTFA